MKMIAVDDEINSLSVLKEAVRQGVGSKGELALRCFQVPEEALEYARCTEVDIAFLDVRMEGMTGLELAAKLKEYHSRINIIFVTEHSDFMGRAFSMHASGYLLKPVKADLIEAELQNLRYPPMEKRDYRVSFKCFGNFDVYIDGRPLRMPESKAKELLAYLVHNNGAGVSTRQVAAVLWEDKEYTRSRQYQLQKVVKTMVCSLERAGAEDIIIRNRNYLAVDTDRYASDYKEVLKGNVAMLNSYMDEYMTEYSWAEFTAASLTRLSQSICWKEEGGSITPRTPFSKQ